LLKIPPPLWKKATDGAMPHQKGGTLLPMPAQFAKMSAVAKLAAIIKMILCIWAHLTVAGIISLIN